jgi:hypothetical protein
MPNPIYLRNIATKLKRSNPRPNRPATASDSVHLGVESPHPGGLMATYLNYIGYRSPSFRNPNLFMLLGKLLSAILESQEKGEKTGAQNVVKEIKHYQEK